MYAPYDHARWANWSDAKIIRMPSAERREVEGTLMALSDIQHREMRKGTPTTVPQMRETAAWHEREARNQHRSLEAMRRELAATWRRRAENAARRGDEQEARRAEQYAVESGHEAEWARQGAEVHEAHARMLRHRIAEAEGHHVTTGRGKRPRNAGANVARTAKHRKPAPRAASKRPRNAVEVMPLPRKRAAPMRQRSASGDLDALFGRLAI